MKRHVQAVLVFAASLVLAVIAPAQTIPGNENDLQLANGIDVVFTYSDPSIGGSGVPDFGTHEYIWKVISKDVLRHCSGAMEVTGMDVWSFDGDYGTFEGPNNTSIADYMLSKTVAGIPIEPDQADATATLLSFGPGGPKNNIFLPDPGCTPPGYVYGYELDVDITGGAGAGSGIQVTANGATDLCFTAFIPGGGQTYSGANSCSNGNGDGVTPDAHSSDAGGAIGETQFDVVGGGVASLFGGFGGPSGTLGADGVHEVAQQFLEFAEPTLAMHVNSSTGQGLEEGLAGVHYDCPPAVGGTIGARLYAWQGLGRPAAVMGTLAAPLAACVNFKGSKLGLSPTDPLFNLFLGLWQGVVVQTDNGSAATGTVFDDGTFTTLSLPLPAQVVPLGVTVPLSFQGFYKKPSGTLEGSQVTRLFLHG